jgi:DnaJ-class molecular chaperone
MSDNPYNLLGVMEDASLEQINKAFKECAKLWHPDKGGDAEVFEKIKRAATVLRDPELRRQYDETGVMPDEKADNAHAAAMERIVNWFINCIEQTGNSYGNSGLDEADFVKGCKDHFKEQIQGSRHNIKALTIRVAGFERVLKRLKTRRKADVVATMLISHTNKVKALIVGQENDIKCNEHALAILEDYSMDVGMTAKGVFLPGQAQYR